MTFRITGGRHQLYGALRKVFGSFHQTQAERGELRDDLRNAIIVSLYKNKGEKADFSNCRGINLVSITGKILAHVLLNRLIAAIAEGLANRGTADMIFILRQIQEKCREQNMGLYTAFIDLMKAFNTVSRDGLWRILSRIGCPLPLQFPHYPSTTPYRSAGTGEAQQGAHKLVSS